MITFTIIKKNRTISLRCCQLKINLDVRLTVSRQTTRVNSIQFTSLRVHNESGCELRCLFTVQFNWSGTNWQIIKFINFVLIGRTIDIYRTCRRVYSNKLRGNKDNLECRNIWMKNRQSIRDPFTSSQQQKKTSKGRVDGYKSIRRKWFLCIKI